ncbi:MAG: hypothetical protein N2Z22_09835, partial [Turneriella sp.]|nr:hypothetical protein [Turneriella sp.]
ILLWLKPARRALKHFFAINYYQEPSWWDSVAGYLVEQLFFWHWREGEKSPWQDIPEDLHDSVSHNTSPTHAKRNSHGCTVQPWH